MAYYYSPFRKEYGPRPEGCPFCDQVLIQEQGALSNEGDIIQNEHYYWMVNWYPKFEGHTMVIPKRHVSCIGEETTEEVVARDELIVLATQTLMKAYPSAGIEIFLQTGKGSARSIPHLHWHVVPSQPSDPLRGFDKADQFFTIKPDEEKIILFPVEIRYAREELRKLIAQTLQRKES